MHKAILYATQINGDGSGTALDDDTISDVIHADQLAWIHLDARQEEARHWISEELSYLDPLIVDALLATETRPRVLEVDNGVLLILRGVNLNEDSEPEDMISIRLWVDPHRIISVQLRNLKSLHEIDNKLSSGDGPKDCGDFITMLVGGLFDKMEPVFTEMDEQLDDIEEKVIERSQAADRQDVNQIRTQAIAFRRYLAPQKDAISILKNAEAQWLNVKHRRKLQEAQDRITRYIEDLDTIRERGQIIKEEIASMLADVMNKNMYVLSVIAAIFLPLGFLTGLLGINVGGIPGADNSSAFMIFCGMLTVIVAAQIAYFKVKKWF